MDILVTNNQLVQAQFQSSVEVEYSDINLLGVLTKVRDLIHKGHRLLTHPLSGSVKPNETLYKTVLITEAKDGTDTQSVTIIEESIKTAQKFPPKQIPEQFKHDMQVVDLSLIRTALGASFTK